MSGKLSEYLVLEVLINGAYNEPCYKVKHKITESLRTWKAYDCENLTYTNLEQIREDVAAVSTSKNLHIIQYHETILHSASDTLYIASAYNSNDTLFHLMEKCKSESRSFSEGFIWNVLRQLAVVCKAMSTIKIVFLKAGLKTQAIFIDSDANIKVDVLYLMADKNNTEYKESCSNLVCRIGLIVYEMCTLTEYAEDSTTTIVHQNGDLQNIATMLLRPGIHHENCHLRSETILRHPTVLRNVKPDCKDIFANPQCLASPTISNDSAFESDDSLPKVNADLHKSISIENMQPFLSPKCHIEPDITNYFESKNLPNAMANVNLSPTLIALDLKIPGYVPPKVSNNVSKWRSRLELYKDPKEVSENALSHVWLERLAALRDREEALRLREKEINMKQRFQEVASQINSELNKDNAAVEKIEMKKNESVLDMPGITLQTAMSKKVVEADIENNKIPRFKGRPSLSDGSVVSNIGRRDSYTKKTYRRSSSVRTRYRKKQQFSYEDMDSSLSADQGDSILPTSTKLSSELVPRPASMHNLSRRKVHFNARTNPFADYETSVSSTTLTFFEIENIDSNYEVPKTLSPGADTVADRIAKFTYLDLEAMTNEKRAKMEAWRKTPPKVNRATKPTLRSRVKAAENLKRTELKDISSKNNVPTYENGNLTKCPSITSRISIGSSRSGSSGKSISSFTSSIRKDSRRKSMSAIAIEEANKKANKENINTAAPEVQKKDSKRKSILGFKTPFKFRL